ncbi:MAG: hypothetical protein KatS3mg110_1807 [Pirellulaceae bacterium]|nr:MAG: hypothetical protein KatS3mg110_1807 [Pirellulaceae bacterium]
MHGGPAGEGQRGQVEQRTHEDVTRNDKEIASAVREALADRVGSQAVELWFSDAQIQIQDGQLRIGVPHAFQAEHLKRRFRHQLQEVCQQFAGPEGAVVFDVVGLPPSRSEGPTEPTPCRVARTEPIVTTANGTRTELVEFVVGEEYRMVLASLDVVLAHPGKITPLYVHGPTGCGKTEFLSYVRRLARGRAGLKRIVSVSAEQFTTEFLEALDGRGLPNFRRKFRDVELLLIDDLQFFSGKKQTLIELQNTIDSLLRAGRQLVLAADRPPGELSEFTASLTARMAAGLVCRLPYPGPETRRQIARRTAGRLGGLSDELIELIVATFDQDARQVVGAVNRILAMSRVLGREPSLEEARQALSDLLAEQKRPVGLADIETAVCTVFGIERRQLHAEGRDRSASHPRMLAMWLARKYTRAGLTEIGRYFGRRSHSTVLSAQRQVERWLANGNTLHAAGRDLPVQEAVRRVESQLRTA